MAAGPVSARRPGSVARTSPPPSRAHAWIRLTWPLFPENHSTTRPFCARFFLEFEDTDWEAQLADFYHTDVELPATLIVDMLGAYPIGIYGIAKTVVGYFASSLGAKLDVENAGARFLVTLGFYLVHAAVYFTVARGMVNMTLNWSWSRGILAGLANAFLGVGLYFLLDKFKQRT